MVYAGVSISALRWGCEVRCLEEERDSAVFGGGGIAAAEMLDE